MEHQPHSLHLDKTAEQILESIGRLLNRTSGAGHQEGSDAVSDFFNRAFSVATNVPPRLPWTLPRDLAGIKK
jgi:hypothetical protein